jgi:hypothetical protein
MVLGRLRETPPWADVAVLRLAQATLQAGRAEAGEAAFHLAEMVGARADLRAAEVPAAMMVALRTRAAAWMAVATWLRLLREEWSTRER